MIILPDRNIPRAKFLLPIHDKFWRETSAFVPKDQLGNDIINTRFKIEAKSNDGVIIWRGWFTDRADFDAFLHALVLGTLKQEKALWDLPTPNWQPYLGEIITYEFATVKYFTSTTQLNWSVPGDWNNLSNTIEAIGGGGTGGNNGSGVGSGGGGGAYAKSVNITLTQGSNVAYRAGAGNSTSSFGSGTSFACNSFFKDGSTLVAAGSYYGAQLRTGSTGAFGGTVANSTYNSTAYRGGNGATRQDSPAAGTPGGAAAGPGGQGGDFVNFYQSGAGGGGSGGAGTSTNAAAGGNGNEFGNGYGSGGGGNGNSTGINSGKGGDGGYYGAGGGGGYNGIGGSGIQGLIVVTYTPKAVGFNSPMMGM